MSRFQALQSFGGIRRQRDLVISMVSSASRPSADIGLVVDHQDATAQRIVERYREGDLRSRPPSGDYAVRFELARPRWQAR